jgi:radical SAM-linked protein
MDCLRQENLDPGVFLRRIPLHARLPWDHIDSLVTKEYLIGDLHKSQKDRFMPACEKPFIPRDPNKTVKPLEHANLVCYDCGLECDLDAIKRERIEQRDSLVHAGEAIEAAFRGELSAPLSAPASAPVRLPVLDATPKNGIPKGDDRATNAFEAASGTMHGESVGSGRDLSPTLHVAAAPTAAPTPRPRVMYRVCFAKRDDLRWLSHLDLMRVLQRAFKRAGIRVAYSQGFHPGPVMSFGPALAVGIEGLGELFDFESPDEFDTAAARQRLNASLPQHLRILELDRLASGAAPLSRCIDLGEYRAWINPDRQQLTPELFAGFDVERFANARWHEARIREFLGRERVEIVRQRGDTQKQIDLRPYVRGIEHRGQSDASPHGDVLLQLRLGSQGQARPQEVLHQLYGLAGECFRVQRLRLGAESALELTESVPAIS